MADKVFKKGSPENKKAILMAIGRNFLLKDDKLIFEFKEPFNWVVELNKSKSYNMSIWRGRRDSNPQLLDRQSRALTN